MASSASSINLSSLKLGTFPFKNNSMDLTEPSMNVNEASVFNSIGLKSASFSTKANFILKHPASAEAISSSGLVPSLPLSFSNLVLKLYGILLKAPL